MAEIDKNNPTQDPILEEKEVDIEIETPTEEGEVEETTEETEEDFYKNLAEDMDDTILSRMSGSLIQD